MLWIAKEGRVPEPQLTAFDSALFLQSATIICRENDI